MVNNEVTDVLYVSVCVRGGLEWGGVGGADAVGSQANDTVNKGCI